LGNYIAAAVVAYALYSRVGPSLFSAVSSFISFVLFYDIFVFHRTSSYSLLTAERHPQRRGIVFLKFIFAVFLAATSFIIFIIVNTSTISGQLGVTGASDSVWPVVGFIMAIIWAVDIGRWHLNLGVGDKQQFIQSVDEEPEQHGTEMRRDSDI